MADQYLIRVDIARIRANLFESPDAERTDEALHAWLCELGLIPQADGAWLCEDLDLQIFAPDELVSQEQVR